MLRYCEMVLSPPFINQLTCSFHVLQTSHFFLNRACASQKAELASWTGYFVKMVNQYAKKVMCPIAWARGISAISAVNSVLNIPDD